MGGRSVSAVALRWTYYSIFTALLQIRVGASRQSCRELLGIIFPVAFVDRYLYKSKD
jgi:hypothetical protein